MYYSYVYTMNMKANSSLHNEPFKYQERLVPLQEQKFKHMDLLQLSQWYQNFSYNGHLWYEKNPQIQGS